MLPPAPPLKETLRGIHVCTVLYVCIVSELYVLYCTVCMYIIRGICTVLYVCILSEVYVLTVCMYSIRGICTVLYVCILSEVYVLYCMYV